MNQKPVTDAAQKVLPAGLVPIAVGVTGHRDVYPEHVDVLKDSIRQQLQAFSAAHPQTPMVFLSALAEGADRIAAEVALELGWYLGAVLPFAQQEYEKDFTAKESLDAFRGLLSKACFTWHAPDQSDLAEKLGGNARDFGYRAAGLYIARHSQILMALWDGGSERKTGGTTDVVMTFREGKSELESGLDSISLPDTGIVWHILTPRLQNNVPIPYEEVGACQTLYPEPVKMPSTGELERWETIWQRIDEFNADAEVCYAERGEGVQRSLGYLGADKVAGQDAAADRAAALFAVADAMAIRNQQSWFAYFRQFVGIAAVVVVFEQLYSGVFFKPIWMLATVLIALLGYGLLMVMRKKCVEKNYLDYRALAEACRVQHFWKLAGIERCAAAGFLRGQRDELEWLRQALYTTQLVSGCAVYKPEGNAKNRAQHVTKHWVDDQKKYFTGVAQEGKTGKAELNQQKSAKWSALSRRFFVLAIVIMLTMAALHTYFLFANPAHSALTKLPYMVVAYSLALAAGGLAIGYSENQGHSENARRYRRMGLAMYIAGEKLHALQADSASSHKFSEIDTQEIFKALGHEALAENSDWLILRRDRPANVPIG